jgi:hypothetical protein
MINHNEKPLVGFFPLFYNLAETGRAVLTAKRFIEMGGRGVFFSHGGRYEYLARDQGFEIIKVNPQYKEESIKRIISINRGEQKGLPYTEQFLREAVREEIIAYKKTGVKLIVSFVNVPSAISARAAKIPLICVSPAPGTFHLSIPDNYENLFSRLILRQIKIKLLNWYYIHNKIFLKPFNIVAREYNLKPFKSSMDVDHGDVTLATQFLEFINVFPKQQIFPNEDYVGIISIEELFVDQFSEDEKQEIGKKIKNHLKKQGKSILLSMGSSGDKKLFSNILQILSKTQYPVIAINANILKEGKIPRLSDNILFLNFVPSIAELHKMVDLSIIHGGQGTIYTAAYAGKPVIGFPMQFEQHLNLEKMVGHGVGLMLSRRYFKERDLLNLIRKIFDNYDEYLNNAKTLAKKLPKPEGDKKAAKRITEILTNYI